jgi:vanillate/4-hydroxybenzoate decarboxylase subunit D
MICPRCRSTEVSTVAQSPVAGRWTMSSCTTCWYAWRSTEPAAAIDPDAYYPGFRLSTEDITSAPRLA